MFLTIVIHLIAAMLYGLGCLFGIVALVDVVAEGVVLFTDPKTTLIYCGIAIVGGILLAIANILIAAKRMMN